MGYECKLVADSISPAWKRITSVQLRFPRSVLAELRTHRIVSAEDESVVLYAGLDDAGRALSINSASSRAIPVNKMLQAVREDPYIPSFTGAQKGMQGTDMSDDEEFQRRNTAAWIKASLQAVANATELLEGGVHKQDVNRLLEPFAWHTVLITATEWTNFLNLRCHPDAHPAIRQMAELIRDTIYTESPRSLEVGEWHLPYIRPEDRAQVRGGIEYIPNPATPAVRHYLSSTDALIRISAGRCARTSYLTQEGTRDIEEDIRLHDRLIHRQPMHASPTEHQAQALSDANEPSGNFFGWGQYRKTLIGEHATTFTYNGRMIPSCPESVAKSQSHSI
jgi:thymidylate synthase ThyX